MLLESVAKTHDGHALGLSHHSAAQELTKLTTRVTAELVHETKLILGKGMAFDLPGVDQVIAPILQNAADLSVPIDCAELTAALQNHYKGIAQSLCDQQVADAFVRAFNLSPLRSPAVRSGRVVLEVSMRLDDIALKFGGEKRYSYSSASSLSGAVKAMAALLARLGASCADEVAASVPSFNGHDRIEVSRSAYPSLGPIGVRAFHAKVELHLPLDLAGEINAFVTEHSVVLAKRGESGH
jgi:hypothetical protein